MAQAPYNIPSSAVKAEIEVKRSKFLIEVRRISNHEEMRAFYKDLCELHPKANHNCWGVICASPEDSSGYGFSDDGEPSGCAGKPIFNVLSHSGFGQIGLVVTRYFGGIKLGTGGMVKAYTEAAKAGIELVEAEEFSPLVPLNVSFQYDLEPSFRHFIQDFSLSDSTFEYSENVQVTLLVKEIDYPTYKERLSDKFGIKVSIK